MISLLVLQILDVFYIKWYFQFIFIIPALLTCTHLVLEFEFDRQLNTYCISNLHVQIHKECETADKPVKKARLFYIFDIIL